MIDPNTIKSDAGALPSWPTVEVGPEPFKEEVQLGFLSNGNAMEVQIRFAGGAEPDEANLCHVLAWYVAQSAGELLPIAIQSWHKQRLAMLAAPAANEA